MPQTILWTWLNLLVFNLANQRLPSSIVEDKVNKPWRPIPANRLTAVRARQWLLAILPVVYMAALYLGGVKETVAIMALTWAYNDLNGADENFIVRNIVNALGFVCWGSGAMIVAIGYGDHDVNETSKTWLTVRALMVVSTLQAQDMADMEGDRARGRARLLWRTAKQRRDGLF